jgi:hypothetical protein
MNAAIWLMEVARHDNFLGARCRRLFLHDPPISNNVASSFWVR